MIFHRQRQLLSLLDALGGDVRTRDFQKLLFLYCDEQDEPSYEFVPYRFGGFSFTSYADKRKLIDKGLLENHDKRWILTSDGQECSRDSGSLERSNEFAGRHSLRGDALVADIYRRFPYFAIRSEIADKLLSGDRAALAAIKRARPPEAAPGIATIGYEGLNMEAYLNRLLKNGVTLLCDVRKNPLSRKYGFSKSTLSNGCEGIGIRYEHLPQLGIASAARKGLATLSDYEKLFESYRADTLPEQGQSFQTIRDWVSGGNRVALTCFEHRPEECHRHCVADALETAYGEIFHPDHL